ncbi:MAG: hypothetical protein V4660_14365 [Pseudomonadota bacterium]
MINILRNTLLLAFICSIVACSKNDHTPSTPASSSVSTNSAAASSTSVVNSSSTNSAAASAVAHTLYTLRIKDENSHPPQVANIATGNLTGANMAIVLVDLAGNVLQKIAFNSGNITKTTEATWTLDLLISPRADCVLVVDLTKPIELTVGDNIYQSNFVYAPVTASYIDVDVASTSAYKNFMLALGGLGTFSSVDVDPVSSEKINALENLIDNIQDIVNDDYYFVTDTLDTALTKINTRVVAIVKQEILNLKSPVTGSAVNLIRDDGGMHFYDASEEPISFQSLIGTSPLLDYEYVNGAFQLVPASTEDDFLVLSSNGWAAMKIADIRVSSYNYDGSVILQNPSADGYNVKLETQQTFDLSGRNIKDFVSSERELMALADLVGPTEIFATGAKGFRLKSSYLDGFHSLNLDREIDAQGNCASYFSIKNVAIDDVAGNCNLVELFAENQTSLGAVTEFTAIFSADVEPNVVGFKTLSVYGSHVQLINNTDKTARFYRLDDGNQLVLTGTGTWNPINLPHLTADESAIQWRVTNPMVGETIFLNDGFDYHMVKQEGFIRLALFVESHAFNNDFASTYFNGTANASIAGALSQPQSLAPSVLKMRASTQRVIGKRELLP